MGAMLVLVGVLMWFAEATSLGARGLGSVHETDAVTIGIAQALAVVPGTSRSGITITAGLFRNFNREAAARFSFLLSTPIIGAAAAKALYDMHKQGGMHAILNTLVPGGRGGQRGYRLPGDCLVPAITCAAAVCARLFITASFLA